MINLTELAAYVLLQEHGLKEIRIPPLISYFSSSPPIPILLLVPVSLFCVLFRGSCDQDVDPGLAINIVAGVNFDSNQSWTVNNSAVPPKGNRS